MHTAPATGIWNVDWITFWGLMLFNTLGVSGVFENFRRWLISQGTLDIRVQTMLFAWAFGALLEGLVGFGYPWAVVAPILISLGLTDLDAIRVSAIANNAPVSYGALGAPIIALGRGDRLSPPGAVRRGRHSGRRPGAAAAMGADLSRGRQGRVQGRLAARRRRFTWLRARPVADSLLLRPVPAGRDRLHRLLLWPAVAAAGSGSPPYPRPWRRAGRSIGCWQPRPPSMG